MDKYYWSFDKNEERWGNSCSSIRECLDAARQKDSKCHTVFIGEIDTYIPVIDGTKLIEELQQEAYEIDDIYGEDWLGGLSQSDINVFQNRINKVLHEWLEETNNMPDFGNIVKIRTYCIKR